MHYPNSRRIGCPSFRAETSPGWRHCQFSQCRVEGGSDISAWNGGSAAPTDTRYSSLFFRDPMEVCQTLLRASTAGCTPTYRCNSRNCVQNAFDIAVKILGPLLVTFALCLITGVMYAPNSGAWRPVPMPAAIYAFEICAQLLLFYHHSVPSGARERHLAVCYLRRLPQHRTALRRAGCRGVHVRMRMRTRE